MDCVAAHGNLTELIRSSSVLDFSVSVVGEGPSAHPTVTAKAIAEAVRLYRRRTGLDEGVGEQARAQQHEPCRGQCEESV
jgi:hypothetical protein